MWRPRSFNLNLSFPSFISDHITQTFLFPVTWLDSRHRETANLNNIHSTDSTHSNIFIFLWPHWWFSTTQEWVMVGVSCAIFRWPQSTVAVAGGCCSHLTRPDCCRVIESKVPRLNYQTLQQYISPGLAGLSPVVYHFTILGVSLFL